MPEIQILKSILLLNEKEWDLVAPRGFPFLSFKFLSALEASGSLGSRTGWEPCYITVWSGEALQGAMIAYLRNNSFGEYIFDFDWANTYARYGQDYYPKLMSAVPFTPATCEKLLCRHDLRPSAKNEVRRLLLSAAKDFSAKLDLSSVHALFISAAELPDFEAGDFFIRHSFQYHWKNQGYKNFDDFLGRLRSKRRKEIQRERAQVQTSGVKISRLTGDQLTAEHGQIMYDFYLSTMEKKSGFDFLTQEFFTQVFGNMKDQILFVLAEKDDGKPVAGALNYYSGDALYGRHWGCLAEYRALHFELCYYQGIEFAIEKQFPLFEAGAQGEHKFNRGFLPCLTYSAHHIRSKPFSDAIRTAVEKEKQQLQLFFADAEAHTPFSRGL